MFPCGSKDLGISSLTLQYKYKRNNNVQFVHWTLRSLIMSKQLFESFFNWYQISTEWWDGKLQFRFILWSYDWLMASFLVKVTLHVVYSFHTLQLTSYLKTASSSTAAVAVALWKTLALTSFRNSWQSSVNSNNLNISKFWLRTGTLTKLIGNST